MEFYLALTVYLLSHSSSLGIWPRDKSCIQTVGRNIHHSIIRKNKMVNCSPSMSKVESVYCVRWNNTTKYLNVIFCKRGKKTEMKRGEWDWQTDWLFSASLCWQFRTGEFFACERAACLQTEVFSSISVYPLDTSSTLTNSPLPNYAARIVSRYCQMPSSSGGQEAK